MSYYRNFANLVSLLGLITLALVAAAVYFGFRVPASAPAPESKPAAVEQAFEPPWAEAPTVAPDEPDPRALKSLTQPGEAPVVGSDQAK